MRRYEKQISKPVEREVLVETCCDLCGLKAERGGWDSSTYEIRETEIKVTVRKKDGARYYDGSWGTDLVVDICPKCFEETLIPFLRNVSKKLSFLFCVRKEW